MVGVKEVGRRGSNCYSWVGGNFVGKMEGKERHKLKYMYMQMCDSCCRCDGPVIKLGLDGN